MGRGYDVNAVGLQERGVLVPGVVLVGKTFVIRIHLWGFAEKVDGKELEE